MKKLIIGLGFLLSINAMAKFDTSNIKDEKGLKDYLIGKLFVEMDKKAPDKTKRNFYMDCTLQWGTDLVCNKYMGGINFTKTPWRMNASVQGRFLAESIERKVDISKSTMPGARPSVEWTLKSKSDGDEKITIKEHPREAEDALYYEDNQGEKRVLEYFHDQSTNKAN